MNYRPHYFLKSVFINCYFLLKSVYNCYVFILKSVNSIKKFKKPRINCIYPWRFFYINIIYDRFKFQWYIYFLNKQICVTVIYLDIRIKISYFIIVFIRSSKIEIMIITRNYIFCLVNKLIIFCFLLRIYNYFI